MTLINQTDLCDIRNHLYEKAERWWYFTLALSISLLLFSCSVFLTNSATLISISGLLGLLLPVAIAWARETSNANLIQADKCRRLILFADALGEKIPPNEIARIRAWAIGSLIEAAPYKEPYYSSEKSPGPDRLADILTESAYFTQYLASKMHFYFSLLFIFSLVFAVVALELADIFDSDTQGTSLILTAKFISVFISFLISGDVFFLAKKFADLKHSANEIFQNCAKLRDNKNTSRHEVQCLADDYGVALLQSPPIPSWLYKVFRDSLNRAYRESHGLKAT